MIAALLLVLSVVVYRVATGLLIHSGAATWLSNFAPFAAIAVCCGAFLPRRYNLVLPIVALFASDVVLNATYHAPLLDPQILCRYLALALAGAIGLALRKHASLQTMLPASIAASILFYLITNGFSWLADPGYVKNLSGFVQSLTVGLPEYGATPTWMFFRNSLLSDLIFTIIFVLCVRPDLARGRADMTVARAV